MPDIINPLPIVLGGRTLTPLARYLREGFAADYAIGGQPWLAAPNDDDPITRGTTPYQRERVDQAASAGESSLSNWWLRSATSWDKGAGITFYDADDTDLGRYADSFNVDVWTEGQISLLHSTSSVSPFITSIADIETCGTGVWVLTSAGALGIWNSTTATGTANITTSCTKMTTDGTNAFVSKSDGIYKVTPGGTVTKIYSAPGGSWTVQALEYIKDRLIVGAQVTDALPMRIFELGRAPATVPTTVSLTTDSRYEFDTSDLTFVGITELTGAILFGTVVGTKSRVLSMTLATTTDGNVTVLEPVTVAELPTGEILRSMRSYLGTFVGLGTSKGLRVASETSNGIGFTYGPLVLEDDVKNVYFNGDYLYATRNVAKGTNKGLWRVALSTEVGDVYAYAPDLSTSAADVTSCCPLGTTGRMAIGTTDGFYVESATDYASSGELTSGLIRFGTTERKQGVSVMSRLSGDPTGAASFRITIQDGTYRDFDSFTVGELTDWGLASQLGPSTTFEVKITLTRGSTTDTPIVEEWQLRGLPAPQKSRTITIPLMCMPRETDSLGNVRVSDAFDRLKVLELLEAYGGAVLYQDFTTGEERVCVVRAVQYEQKGPPSFKDGFSGRVTVQLQTVDTEI